MDLECQLVSHGLYCGDASGYQATRAKELEAGRQDWILLLQLDTDDDAGMMWGDGGMLYFWIRKEDLERSRFDRCWMILQCSWEQALGIVGRCEGGAESLYFPG